MSNAKELKWAAFSDDPLQLTFRVKGLDLSSTVMKYLVQETPHTSPIITLNHGATAGTDGIRVVSVGMQDGLTYSDVEILVTQPTLDAALAAFPDGDQIPLYHKFQWTISGGTFTTVDKTAFYGDLTIYRGLNG